MATRDLVEILERWRSAVRDVDSTAVDSPERAAAEARAEQRRLEYRAAAVQVNADADEVEGAFDPMPGLTMDDSRQAEPERAAAEA